ncbi:MAG: penicillin-binding protein 1A [Gammaproteobacteria bacterium]|nr:penicillin-binding protein 1A [Gammaproteobacteria bacterium]
MPRANRFIRRATFTLAFLMTLGIFTLVAGYLYLEPKLPSIDLLKDIQLQEPMRIYARDGELISEFGDMKRIPLNYEQFPEDLINAVIAAEDDRFFKHMGVDFQGLLRAAYQFASTGEKRQGASTITMQVARNFFLSREKTFLRKFNEILLSFKIERELTKQEILELYLNKIYLGKRSYGMEAAANIYYGKPLEQLNLAQIAMLAGLPKAPSRYNPIINPERALIRRNYVLRRMKALEMIDEHSFQEAVQQPVNATLHITNNELDAPYVAEMVRAELIKRYGNEIYQSGYRIYTTIDAKLQKAANHALKQNIFNYDMRHGYRGVVAHSAIDENTTVQSGTALLQNYPSIGELESALVVSVGEKSVKVLLRDASIEELSWEAIAWAKPFIDDNRQGPPPQTASDILRVGDVVYLLRDEQGLQLRQIPEVSGALVSLNPKNGALLALVGGFDFYKSKFNRAVQAQRQPGSNLKPFIYSAALENGFTTASIINDAPVVFEDSNLESEWRPENYSGRTFGPTRLREGLVRSRNLISIRILRAMGVSKAIDHLKNFGFDPSQLPRDLSLALGSVSLTPYQLVHGYAVLANGGFLIEPHFIQRIEDSNGNIIMESDPAVACDDSCKKQLVADMSTIETIGTGAEGMPPEEADNVPVLIPKLQTTPKFAPRTISAQNIYLIRSIMQDVIKRGTGRRARALGRNDIAGKTGTTNDQRDAWFSGFNPDVVTTAWVGFDTPRSLGNRETGGHSALPMWIDYMKIALADYPDNPITVPPGIVTVRINSETGKYTDANDPKAIFESFRVENAPQAEADSAISDTQNTPQGNETEAEELF